MVAQVRADHLGSFLRPPELKDARARYMDGRSTLEDLRAVEDRAILDVLAMQRDVGVDVFTDGEYRRYSFMSGMVEALDGFTRGDSGMQWQGPGPSTGGGFLWVVGARLQQKQRLTQQEVLFLEKHAPGPFKITLPSANLFVMAGFKPGITDQFYSSRSELRQELVAVVRREIRALVDAGVPYIQLDAPGYTTFVDEKLRERMRQRGIDPDQALDEEIAADQACLDGARRPGLTLGLHLCRGNSQSRWLAEGGYDAIAEKLFNAFPVDRFLLEYDTARAGGFEPLRFVPRGTTVVLGLVTSKEGRLETQGELLRRIDEATRYVPLDNLALSPQCGFASSLPGNLLSADDQRRKLELVVATAREVWT
jgi:5-methyltetrahydropteroyltriglutamate--homocysteine methyltransferase